MELLPVHDTFWNIRASFKLAGIDIGTQASLIRCQDGSFIFLDCCQLSEDVLQSIRKLTENGQQIRAIINLHPFHTIHVAKMHELFPKAELYGTARHLHKFPDLPWQKETTESKQLHEKFAVDLLFSIPEGVDFIAKNDKIHFSSVLAYHRQSKTIHVDDTLMYSKMPGFLSGLGWQDNLSFHPTLAFALQNRSEAADEFEQWVKLLIEQWQDAENLCCAHTDALLHSENSGRTIAERIDSAIKNTKWILSTHRVRFSLPF